MPKEQVVEEISEDITEDIVDNIEEDVIKEEPQENPSPDEQARKLGWVPKEEFRGSDENWMEADIFLKKRGDELSQTRKEVRELTELMRENAKQSRVREEKAYEKALAELKTQQRAAIREGDEEAFDAVEKEIASIQKVAPKERTPPDEVVTWKESNPWYDKDPELGAAAEAYHVALNNRQPNLSLEDNLKAVATHIKKIFPEKFKSKPKPPPIEGGAPPNGRQSSKSVHDLPPDVLAIAKRMVAKGDFKDLAEYAKDYFSGE